MAKRRVTKLTNIASVPKLSVVVASLNGKDSLQDCLDSILADAVNDIEIIVTGRDLNGSTSEFADKYRGVDFIESSNRAQLPELLAAGIARTRGEVIALTDSTCVVSNGWTSSILRAHNETWPVIGGRVDNASNEKLVNWAAYFCDYSQFMSPATGVASAVPGNNLSFKRQALEVGSAFVEKKFWKTHWCRSLQANGTELFLDPAISVRCAKNYEPAAFLVKRFHQGRSFARVRSMQMNIARRILFAAGSPILPFLLTLRAATPVIREKKFWGKFLLSMPLVLAASVAWSTGEAIGYLAGPETNSDGIH
jgi:glycosyltransferase involved in cell wall biosynthesis